MKKKEFSDADFEMFTMPSGKYKGVTLAELPASYIVWIMDKEFCPDVLREYAEINQEDLVQKTLEEIDDIYFN